ASCHRQRCDDLRRLGGLGKPLEVVFGGPHSSEPSFLRAGVRPGDDIYPVTIRAGVLYVLGRIRVGRMLLLEDYVTAHTDLFAPYLQDPPAWVFEPGRTRLSPRFVQALEAFARFRQAHPELPYLAPPCTEEAVECVNGTPLSLELAVPTDLLLRLRYRSQRRERDLHKHICNGRLMHSLCIQGIYRLSEPSAREFAALIEGIPSNVAAETTKIPSTA